MLKAGTASAHLARASGKRQPEPQSQHQAAGEDFCHLEQTGGRSAQRLQYV